MNYTEIEMEGMKEILRDKEEYIKKLEEENKRLKEAFEIADMCVNNTTNKNKKLSEKIGQLKSDLAFERTMLDNVKAEYESSQNVIKKLKKRVKEHTTYSVKAEFIKKFGE